MNEKPNQNYLRNTSTSNNRTIRVEVVGEVSKEERNFLNGLSFFAAGTMSKDDAAHTKFVSGLMADLVKKVVEKMRQERKEAGLPEIDETEGEE